MDLEGKKIRRPARVRLHALWPELLQYLRLSVDDFVSYVSLTTSALDLRSLAFFRFLLASVILYDIWDRFPYIYAWYTDFGIVSRKTLFEQFWANEYISVHVANGSYIYMVVLFLLHGFSAFLLMIGYRTTLNCIIQWYMHASMQIRNPIVLHNGDVYIRLVLFFSMFLPLGERWSVDAWLREKNKKRDKHPPVVSNACTFALILQLWIVYGISFFHKYYWAHSVWFENGTATYYALNLDYYRLWLGELLLRMGMPTIKFTNWMVLYWELLGPCLYFSPWKHHWCRMIGVLGTVLLHFGFGSAIRLETFYLTGMMATTGLLPSWLWDDAIPYLLIRFDRGKRFIGHKIIQYDRRRGFRLARFIEVFCCLLNARISAFDSPEDDPLNSRKGDTESNSDCLLVYTDETTGRVYYDYSALQQAFAASLIFWPLALIMKWNCVHALGEWLLDYLYERPAAEMSVAAKVAAARKKRHNKIKLGPLIRNSISGFFIAYCWLWNGGNMGWNGFPSAIRSLAFVLMLYQSWNMFCPPPTYTWYHVIEGRLANNQTVDLMAKKALHTFEIHPFKGFDVPEYDQVYPTNRWHKMFEGLTFGRPWNAAVMLEFGRYICREWNKRHTGGEVLMAHKTWIMTQQVRLDWTRGPWIKELQHDHVCF